MRDALTGGDIETDDGLDPETAPTLGSRMRAPVAIALFILVLLMTVCTVVGTLTQFKLSKLQFIARNAECLSCHAEVAAQLRRTSQHQPFLDRHCTSCHTPHGMNVEVRQKDQALSFSESIGRWLRWGPFSILLEKTGMGSARAAETNSNTTNAGRSALGKSELRSPVSTLCWGCHPNTANELQASTTHVPFRNGHCTSCHNPHASDMDPLLHGDEKRICAQCHPMPDLFRANLHQPADSWQCRSCHRPHSSDVDGMLVARQGVLCLSCHPEVAGDGLRRIQHKPFGDDKCTGCHEPHGAPEQPLLIASEPQLCYGCHKLVESEFQSVSHHPIGTKIECSSCHWHHSAPYANLVRIPGNKLCYSCHGGYQSTLLTSKHGLLGCVECHGPHGSDNAPILKKRNPNVCLRCHTPRTTMRFAGVSAHPASPEYWDRYAGKPLTCTSSCHGPHGTNFGFMLKEFGFPYDGGCIRCHTKVGIDF